MITRLARWVRGRGRRDASHLIVTLYTRTGCGCCEKARGVLDEFQGRYGFAIEAVDVDGDPALAAAHGMSVPVVAVGGKVRFRGVVNPVLFQRLLDAESRGN